MIYFLADVLLNSQLSMVKFLNWLRTRCVVSLTTVATRHTWTADLWADFEQRIIDRVINEWKTYCGPVSRPDDCTPNTCCTGSF